MIDCIMADADCVSEVVVVGFYAEMVAHEFHGLRLRSNAAIALPPGRRDAFVWNGKTLKKVDERALQLRQLLE